jgi:hypothetical protein
VWFWSEKIAAGEFLSLAVGPAVKTNITENNLAQATYGACWPDFLKFISRNSRRWKCGLSYTLTTVSGSGKTGRPNAGTYVQR